MKSIQYYRYGGPEEMLLETYELPDPGSDEIVVRVKASSMAWRSGIAPFESQGKKMSSGPVTRRTHDIT